MKVWVAQLCVILCDPMDCRLPGFSVHSPGKHTGVGCHSLLQGIFPTQGLDPGLLHWQGDSLSSEPLEVHTQDYNFLVRIPICLWNCVVLDLSVPLELMTTLQGSGQAQIWWCMWKGFVKCKVIHKCKVAWLYLCLFFVNIFFTLKYNWLTILVSGVQWWFSIFKHWKMITMISLTTTCHITHYYSIIDSSRCCELYPKIYLFNNNW